MKKEGKYNDFSVKYQWKRFVDICKYLFRRILAWEWITISLIIISLAIALFVFINLKNIQSTDTKSTLETLLTVNGLFSAILITYLFSSLNWIKERKFSYRQEALKFSKKLTEFRRILRILTERYDLWRNQNATKNLIDNYEFSDIDYYDFEARNIQFSKPRNLKKINKLLRNSNFISGESHVFLAMSSIIKERKLRHVHYPELYNDYEINKLYHPSMIEKWIQVEIFHPIAYWLGEEKLNCINYHKIVESKQYVLDAAIRINPKYSKFEFGNELIGEIAKDFNEHYLKELYRNLIILKQGLDSPNLIILLLVISSLIFGVMIPFILLVYANANFNVWEVASFTIAINIGTFFFFITKLPSLIRKEIKWI